MNRCDHEIKCGEDLITVIQPAIVQDIALNTFKNMKRCQLLI